MPHAQRRRLGRRAVGLLDTTTPGAHTFQVTATDKAGNETVVLRNYTVLEPDTTDPVVEVDVPAEPASGWYLDEVTVRLTASDALPLKLARSLGFHALDRIAPLKRRFALRGMGFRGDVSSWALSK